MRKPHQRFLLTGMQIVAFCYLPFVFLQEEERKKRHDLEAIMEENNRKIEEAQRKLAEDQLKLVEEQRKILEEKQRLEEEEKRRQKRDQEVILNKKNARPRLSFSLNAK